MTEKQWHDRNLAIATCQFLRDRQSKIDDAFRRLETAFGDAKRGQLVDIVEARRATKALIKQFRVTAKMLNPKEKEA